MDMYLQPCTILQSRHHLLTCLCLSSDPKQTEETFPCLFLYPWSQTVPGTSVILKN